MAELVSFLLDLVTVAIFSQKLVNAKASPSTTASHLYLSPSKSASKSLITSCCSSVSSPKLFELSGIKFSNSNTALTFSIDTEVLSVTAIKYKISFNKLVCGLVWPSLILRNSWSILRHRRLAPACADIF